MIEIMTNMDTFFLHEMLPTEGFVSSSSTRTRNSMMISARKISSAKMFRTTKTQIVTNVNARRAKTKRCASVMTWCPFGA